MAPGKIVTHFLVRFYFCLSSPSFSRSSFSSGLNFAKFNSLSCSYCCCCCCCCWAFVLLVNTIHATNISLLRPYTCIRSAYAHMNIKHTQKTKKNFPLDLTIAAQSHKTKSFALAQLLKTIYNSKMHKKVWLSVSNCETYKCLHTHACVHSFPISFGVRIFICWNFARPFTRPFFGGVKASLLMSV